jgi:SAM-dependent methyltransferase
MSQSKPSWGTAAWFGERYVNEGTSRPTAYFAYKSNGYQMFRHFRLIKILRESSDLFFKSSRLVDIGCATGYLSNKIGKEINVKNITAIDFSPELLEEGRKSFPEIDFKEGCLPNIPLDNNKTDIVSLVEVLYYIEKEKRLDALLECRRLLKDDGVFIFTANVSGEPYLTLNEIDSLFSDASFHIKKKYLEHYWLPIYAEGFFLRTYRLSNLILFPDISIDSGLARAEKYARYLRNPLGRFFAKVGLIISTKLISSRTLMSSLAVINRFFQVGGVTHAIFITVKK